MAIRPIAVALFALLATSCSSIQPNSMTIEESHSVMSAPVPGILPFEQGIGPSDILSIKVFQEPELSSDRVIVDQSGRIAMPLVGSIPVAGLTSSELAQELSVRLGSRFLVNPQVAVNVVQAANQRLTVEGQVKKPGVFAKTGQMTLLQAIAMAEGTSEIARLDEIIVFRNVSDRRLVARFDLAQIRSGHAADPELVANDIVVVGTSRARQIYRDILTVLPALAGVFVAVESGN